MLQGLESLYDVTSDYSQRNYSDSLRMDQIARLTTQMQGLTMAILDLQQRLGLRGEQGSSYPIQALSSPARETLHQAAKSEDLLWGQEQTGTIHSPAPAKDHSNSDYHPTEPECRLHGQPPKGRRTCPSGRLH